MMYQRILIKAPNWLGDAVMALPTIKAMRHMFPDSHIALLAKSTLAELFKHDPAVNEVISEVSPPVRGYESGKGITKIGAELRLIKHLKRQKFDLALLLPRSFHSALVSYLTRIPERVGYAGESRSGLLTRTLPRSPEILRQHRVYYFLNLLSIWTSAQPCLSTEEGKNKICVNQCSSVVARTVPVSAPKITLSGEEEQWALTELASSIRNPQSRSVRSVSGVPIISGSGDPDHAMPHGCREYRDAIRNSLLIGFNPGATYGDAKCWPPERFIELGKQLLNKHPEAYILLFGGPAERKLSAQIHRHLPSNRSVSGVPNPSVALRVNLASGRVVDFTGKTSVLQLAALLKHCQVLVTNDTGPMHVAAAVGTPVVALFGPTDPVTTSPAGSNHIIVRKELNCAPCLKRTCPKKGEAYHKCMKLISVEDVLKAGEKYLG